MFANNLLHHIYVAKTDDIEEEDSAIKIDINSDSSVVGMHVRVTPK